MFVFNDLNIVYCALATVSAAVGYGFTRRRSQRHASSNRAFDFPLHSQKARRDSTSSASDVSCGTPVSMDTEASECGSGPVDYPTPVSIEDINEPDSLKRKHSDEDDIDNSIEGERVAPPLKRIRSSHTPGTRATTPQPEPLDIEVTPDFHSAEDPAILVTDAVAAISENSPSTTSTTIKLNGAVYSIPAYKPSTAFSAFAGSSSHFSLAVNTTDVQRPAWRSVTPPIIPEQSVVSGDANIGPNEATAAIVESSVSAPVTVTEATDNPLAALAYTPSTHTVISGEEEEDINAELRGVKLFVKRGEKEFSAGMLGHIKYLCDRHTGKERLVFRREPVWKVSMSVRLRPSIRCSFDEEQGVLRITLKELDEESSEHHVVIYALKRGKTPQADFNDFARDILRSTQLSNKPQPDSGISAQEAEA
ncbi:hypothetical protein BDY19DRAFT_991249 [Irpex rosettiformis]|uniref:Uncharacterized protein n=1 Tax=Irpex rosettiformis TaxID=378272 RepID=A0ACB8UB77_9APHY|nr:hypothetical protein BDY19DRAFT_991249 [Irpex rosettiformis]